MESADEESIQRLLNESRKRRIEERFGGTFSNPDGDLPAEAEAQWLENIEEFEQQFEDAEEITVREYIGNPDFPPAADVRTGELRRLLRKIFDLLEENNIHIHFCRELPAEEKYRFLVEELLDTEVTNVRIEGMTQNYIYEEFHPDDRMDAMMYADMFLRDVFVAREHDLSLLLSKEQEEKRKLLLQQIRLFRGGIATVMDFDVAMNDCAVQPGSATVTAEWSIEALEAGTLKQVSQQGRVTVALAKDGFGGWLVTNALWDPPHL